MYVIPIMLNTFLEKPQKSAKYRKVAITDKNKIFEELITWLPRGKSTWTVFNDENIPPLPKKKIKVLFDENGIVICKSSF